MWSIHNLDRFSLTFSVFVAGRPSPYFLRGQMANMTFECGTLSWSVTPVTNSLMDRYWEILLMLNLLRYTRQSVFWSQWGKAAEIQEASYLHSARVLLWVTRSACSWDGKLQRAVLMFCPSCCKPMEMTLSCLRSLKTSSWRCRSHTQSKLCHPFWGMKCTGIWQNKNKVIYLHRHFSTFLRTMGHLCTTKSDWVTVTFQLCSIIPESTERHSFICCYASFCGNHGAC